MPTAIEWTDETKICRVCDAPKPLTSFSKGKATCKECRNSGHRAKYEPKGRPLRSGPPPQPARDGDKRQARSRVNQMVLHGRLPRPNDVPCFDCGHRFMVGDKRHEYDHFLGYDAQHHLAVQAVCSTCHHRRAKERGELKGSRRAA